MSSNTPLGRKISEIAEDGLVLNSSTMAPTDDFFIASFADDMKDAPFDDLTPAVVVVVVGKGSEKQAGRLTQAALEVDRHDTSSILTFRPSSHLQSRMSRKGKKAKGLLRTWETRGIEIEKRRLESKPRDIFGRGNGEGIRKKMRLLFSLAPITMGEVLLLGLKEDRQLRSRKVRNVLRVGEKRVEMFRCEVESPLRGVWGWVEEEGEGDGDGEGEDVDGLDESGVK